MRYIDVDKLLKSAVSKFKCVPLVGVSYCRNGEEIFDGEDLQDFIRAMPTANVVEIPEGGIGDLSDGYHTFNELYHHRAILFSVICRQVYEYGVCKMQAMWTPNEPSPCDNLLQRY